KGVVRRGPVAVAGADRGARPPDPRDRTVDRAAVSAGSVEDPEERQTERVPADRDDAEPARAIVDAERVAGQRQAEAGDEEQRDQDVEPTEREARDPHHERG